MRITFQADYLIDDYTFPETEFRKKMYIERIGELTKAYKMEINFLNEINHFKSIEGQLDYDFELKKELRRKINNRIKMLKNSIKEMENVLK